MANEVRHEKDGAQRAALDDLRRLSRESDLFGGLAGATRRAGRHFSGTDAGDDDRIEVWGKRIGRTLSLAAFLSLAVWLLLTYLR
jgi:hypothetical protein